MRIEKIMSILFIRNNMYTFQRTILIVAIVVLLIAFTVIGLILAYSTNKSKWPPVIASCPDYWIAADPTNNLITQNIPAPNSKGSYCVNVKNLGTCPSGEKSNLIMDFNVAPYNGANSSCAKYTWAKNCGISWDGITYGVDNPCANPSV